MSKQICKQKNVEVKKIRVWERIISIKKYTIWIKIYSWNLNQCVEKKSWKLKKNVSV